MMIIFTNIKLLFEGYSFKIDAKMRDFLDEREPILDINTPFYMRGVKLDNIAENRTIFVHSDLDFTIWTIERQYWTICRYRDA